MCDNQLSLCKATVELVDLTYVILQGISDFKYKFKLKVANNGLFLTLIDNMPSPGVVDSRTMHMI